MTRETITNRLGEELFSIDYGRMVEVFGKMLPVFDEHQDAFRKHGIHPQFSLLETLAGYEGLFQAQMLFLAAYFDHLKVSQIHYGRDMPVVITELAEGTLFDDDRFLFSPGTARDTDLDAFQYLLDLTPSQRNLFLRARMYTAALKLDEYEERKMVGDTRNNIQHYFETVLQTMHDAYGNDPRKMYEGAQRKGIRKHCAFLGWGLVWPTWPRCS